ncbi:MAG: hypothetical protein ACREEM_14545 [Blastocatellia bacterium]
MLYDDPTVSISLSGLMLFCINDKKHCEVGILRCPHHDFVMDIQKVTTNPRTGETQSSLESHPLSLDRDIVITTGSDSEKGVEQHTNKARTFDRKNDQGDPTDFRWVINIEGEAFKNKKHSKRPPARGVKDLTPKIYITGGKLYTEMLSDEHFIVESLTDADHKVSLGRVAFKIGLDIISPEVILHNKGNEAESKTLKKASDTRYLITFDNVCPPARNTGDSSDFLFFFDAVSNVENERFDLRRIVKHGGRGEIGRLAPDNNGFSLDDHGQICLFAFMSQSKGFTGD